MNDSGVKLKRCTDCTEHSGVAAQLEAGKDFMKRLEGRFDTLADDFSDHVRSSAKSTNAILIGIIMCFLTGVVGIYVSNTNDNTNQAKVKMIIEETIKGIKK